METMEWLSDDIITEKLNNHWLPSGIYKIFSNVKCERDVMKVLKGIQDEEDPLLAIKR